MPLVMTEQNQRVLECVARYYVLTRRMIQTMCFPDVSTRWVCERIRRLKKEGYISRANMSVVLAGHNATPVYYPNKKTAEVLAALHDDESFLHINTKQPARHLLFHWTEISKTQYLVRQAVDGCDEVSMPCWFNEWETINKGVPDKSLHFTLHTTLQQSPPIRCLPDAAFLVERNQKRKAFYVEVDRGTDALTRIVKKKFLPYLVLFQQDQMRKHFPSANVAEFSVLFITTTRHRRDELKRQSKKAQGHRLWRFACREDLTSESFFVAPVWHAVDKPPNSLISVK